MFDLDVTSCQHAAKQLPDELRGRIVIREWDLTGVLPKLLVSGSPLPSAEDLLWASAWPYGQFDLTISVCVATQLLGPYAFLPGGAELAWAAGGQHGRLVGEITRSRGMVVWATDVVDGSQRPDDFRALNEARTAQEFADLLARAQTIAGSFDFMREVLGSERSRFIVQNQWQWWLTAVKPYFVMGGIMERR